MAKDDVRPGDPEGLDESMPRLDRIQEKLVVEAEPDQLGADHRRAGGGLAPANGGDFVAGQRRGTDVAVGGDAEEHFMALFGIERGRAAAIAFDIVRMGPHKENVHGVSFPFPC